MTHQSIFVAGLNRQVTKQISKKDRFVLTNKHGTPLNVFYFNDCEASEILNFTNRIYSVYSTKKEAQEKVEQMLERCNEEKTRWGQETYDQVVTSIKAMKVKQLS